MHCGTYVKSCCAMIFKSTNEETTVHAALSSKNQDCILYCQMEDIWKNIEQHLAHLRNIHILSACITYVHYM